MREQSIPIPDKYCADQSLLKASPGSSPTTLPVFIKTLARLDQMIYLPDSTKGSASLYQFLPKDLPVSIKASAVLPIVLPVSNIACTSLYQMHYQFLTKALPFQANLSPY